MQYKHCCISPRVDPVDQEDIQNIPRYSHSQGGIFFLFVCIETYFIVSLEVFMVAVFQEGELCTCFSLFDHGVSYFWVFLSQTPNGVHLWSMKVLD